MTDEIYYDENRNVIDRPLEQLRKEQAEQEAMKVVDCNGTELIDGDSIVAIKGLKVKGGTDIKKGDKFTNIRLGDDPTHVSAKSAKNGTIFLKTEYFKKV